MTSVDHGMRAEITAGDNSDPTAITAQISLPAAVWERLTAHLRDDDRIIASWQDGVPDTPLSRRIETYLEMKLLGWEDAVTDRQESGDLDDEVPF